MKRIVIGAGVGFDRHGKPIAADEVQACKVAIVRLLSYLFGGVTITDTFGGWKDGSGQLVMEHGISVTVYADDAGQAQLAAEHVRDILNQTAVYLVIDLISAKLV